MGYNFWSMDQSSWSQACVGCTLINSCSEADSVRRVKHMCCLLGGAGSYESRCHVALQRQTARSRVELLARTAAATK